MPAAALTFMPTELASADAQFVDDGREGISLNHFEAGDQAERLFRKVVPVRLGAGRAKA